MKAKLKSTLLLSVLVMLAGCSTKTSESENRQSNESSKPTESSKENEEAKPTENGEKSIVNVYMPSPAGLQSAIEAGFEKAYSNIDMVVTSGTTGELLAKIEAEKSNPVCDVLILASWSDGINALTNLDLTVYTPKDADKLNSAFVESSHRIYGTSASAVGVLYNTDLVNKAEIEALDWADFGKAARWNMKNHPTSIPDPTKSGAAKDFFAGFVTHSDETANWAILDSWVSNGITNGGGNKPALAAVENGSIDALIAGVDYNAYADKQKGKKIDIYFPKSGTVVNARPAMIMASGAHQEQAKKVMDYLITPEAQGFVADAYLIPGRDDIATSSLRLGLSQINQFSNLNWNTMASKGTEVATTLVGKIANK